MWGQPLWLRLFFFFFSSSPLCFSCAHDASRRSPLPAVGILISTDARLRPLRAGWRHTPSVRAWVYGSGIPSARTTTTATIGSPSKSTAGRRGGSARAPIPRLQGNLPPHVLADWLSVRTGPRNYSTCVWPELDRQVFTYVRTSHTRCRRRRCRRRRRGRGRGRGIGIEADGGVCAAWESERWRRKKQKQKQKQKTTAGRGETQRNVHRLGGRVSAPCITCGALFSLACCPRPSRAGSGGRRRRAG